MADSPFQFNLLITGRYPCGALAAAPDVAAELSLDSRHFRCARCNAELGQAAGSFGAAAPIAVKSTDAEQSARELLARWNAQNVLTPLARSNEDKSQPLVKSEDRADREVQAERTSKKRRMDQAEAHTISLPELNIHTPAPRPASWSATIGQVCAYLGIGLITCGTAVVVWGYFGGPSQYAPTGWLVTTIGQMFLFLGVVTLVSSGMEQTAAEVASRMETLGARLIRIESLQHQLSGRIVGGRQKLSAANREIVSKKPRNAAAGLSLETQRAER